MNYRNVLKILFKDLIGVIGMLLLSIILGMGGNLLRAKPLPFIYLTPEERINTAVNQISTSETSVTSSFELKLIGLLDVQGFIDNKTGVVLDARPRIFYGLGHIPSALNLPREDFEKSYKELQSTLEQNRDRPLLVYCADESCEDSELVAKALHKLGYSQILLFKGGWNEWSKAELPVEKSS
jgi:rhodanese-related sulfurtransferase